MSNTFIWIFSISGFILGGLGLFIGVWDLKVDLSDRRIDIDDFNDDNPEQKGKHDYLNNVDPEDYADLKYLEERKMKNAKKDEKGTKGRGKKERSDR
jgi:hypothetical protein